MLLAVLLELCLFVTYMTILWVRLPHMGAMPKDHGEYILLFGEPTVSFTWSLFAGCVAMPAIRRHVDPYGHEDVHDNDSTILSYHTREILARLVKEDMEKQPLSSTTFSGSDDSTQR